MPWTRGASSSSPPCPARPGPTPSAGVARACHPNLDSVAATSQLRSTVRCVSWTATKSDRRRRSRSRQVSNVE
eukprot:7161458-Pyramimonas_sp.AAC.1